MEMRAKDDIEIGQDITPPLPPLAFSLYDSSLSSHCSSCFLPLPSSATTTTTTTFLRYCSNGGCSSSSISSLHFSSAEHRLLSLLHSKPSLFPHSDTSDLRLSLRLLHRLAPHTPSPRLLGLLTNRHNLLSDEENSARVRAGAKVMAMAQAMRDEREFEFGFGSDDGGFELEEAVLCLVITNAVEINIDGERVGIGVYDRCFSWINHSCSPNSCFRFVAASVVSEGSDGSSLMRILPCGDAAEVQDEGACTTCDLAEGGGNYGPRLIVRSIKGIQRGEEVTITYTDLLQPTELRQSELLLEYKFFCNCKRCSAMPQTYVDHALQLLASTISTFDKCAVSSLLEILTPEDTVCIDHKSCSKAPDKHDREEVVGRLRDMLDNTIAEYMEVGDPVSCCEKVEKLLSQSWLNHVEQTRGTFHIHVKLSPLHYISLNACTTLISTYKVCAGLRIGETQSQNLDMSRTSAAYSLLLASAAHHLFMSEPSLIVSASTYWIDVGQSLLCVGRSPSWDSSVDGELRQLSAVAEVDCPRCSVIEKFELMLSSGQIQYKAFNDISQEYYKCMLTITQKVWSFLVQGSRYLKDVRDPMDFSWIRSMSTSTNTRFQCDEFHLCHESNHEDLIRRISENVSVDSRTNTFLLGVHCLLYGGYLLSICYGDSYSTRLIRNVINI